MFNSSLYPLVDNDEFLVWQMTQEFRHHWPQFNEHTKVQLTQERVVIFHELDTQHIEPPSMLLKPIPVGRQFKYWLFNRPIPDDYEGRWAWQKTLWMKAFKVPQYAILRFVGKLLKRPRILAATMEWTPDTKASTPMGQRVEIRLQRFGWHVRQSENLYRNYPKMQYVDAGYYPSRDVLFVRVWKD